ncbi:MAG: SCO family protein [Chloroflexi bacterium]|nr:SCO family protein [Chloroflexota bacterium]
MKLSGRIFYTSITAITAAIVAFAVFRPITVLPRSTIAPGWSLTDASGRAINSEMLRGHMVLYNFSSADCSGTCASQQSALQALFDRLDRLPTEPPITFITLRVDGSTITAHAAHGHEWLTLSGDAPTLKRVVGAGFGVFYDRTTLEPALVLVDGWGIRRAEYRQPQPSVDALERDLGLLLDEARNSTGIARYAYEAAHLFLCYPT